jgi:predicted aconitase
MLAEGAPAEVKAMELLVALGEIYEADRLIPVSSVHVSGASYKIVGDAGLRFLEEFSETARVRVRTTVNPVGMDLRAWRGLGIPEDFASKQARIVEAYRRMGVEETWSCIPYQIGNRPRQGEHVAWAESSASIFANSVLGARTNREGGPSALAAAITGWTPNYGLHLDESRKATVRVRVEGHVRGYEYHLLGHYLGKVMGRGVPFIQGLVGGEDDLKALGTALATSSDITMFHVEDVTPEWKEAEASDLEVLHVAENELQEAKEQLMTADEYEMIAFGCPQLSESELEEVADLMEAHRPKMPVWAFTSRRVAERAADSVKRIQELGGRVVLDTCPEVMPLDLIAHKVGSPSAKAAVYLPSLSGQRVVIEDSEKLMRRAS